MIFVDYRMGSAELVPALRRLGLDVEETTLTAGDVAFVGRGEGGKEVNVGIEFKKVGELVQSIRTERLQGFQLFRMREEYDFSYLLVEGEVLFDAQGQMTRRVGRRDFKRIGMSIAEYMKRIMVLHLRGGLNYMRSESRAETLREIECLFRVWTDKDLDDHDSHIGIYTAPSLVPLSEYRQMLAPLDGVGQRTSLALEIYFNGSLERTLQATVAELAVLTTVDKNGKPRKLGEATARKIHAAIQRVR